MGRDIAASEDAPKGDGEEQEERKKSKEEKIA